MRRPLSIALGAGALATTLVAGVPVASAHDGHGSGSSGGRHQTVEPVLTGRATLSADHLAEGPPSGALASPANGRSGPFAGQVIPGFSGLVVNGDGTFLAMPDNGFGSKSNSADFLLRLYEITVDWDTGSAGAGAIDVGGHISLADPNHVLDFPIVNDATPERLLTGNDFDIESVNRAADGSLWIGEEFGPFLLHFAADGTLLDAPVSLPDFRGRNRPGLKSPGNPYLQAGETPLVRSSRGFEAVAASGDGRTLYPIVEGSLADDAQPRRRYIYEFDTRTKRYTGRTWQYETDRDANVIGDAFMSGRNEIVLIERDDFQGPASVTKRLYSIDLRRTDRDGYVEKSLVADLLRIANPAGIGTTLAPGAYGVGDPFAFAGQSVEVVQPLGDGRLVVGLDNNYPGGSSRYAGQPDDTELITIDFRKVRDDRRDTLIIGHRGASGHRPEHTLAAYETAILQCADYIEPDLVSTKDGVLVARHENEIGGTTDVASRAEFLGRKTTKTIDGVAVTGWFTEDFTLAELKTLRAVERIPGTRPANVAYNGLYEIPTFDEVLDLARHSRTCDGQAVGVYPETKHPTYFDSIGRSLEEPLLATLAANGLDRSSSPVYIQSFETANLRELSRRTRLPLVQLVNCTGAPYDLVATGDTRTYADLVTANGLKEIATYADGVGLCKDVIIPRDAAGNLTAPTRVVRDAHRRGLEVHAWTFRAENSFLPLPFRSSATPADLGDLAGEIQVFVDAGIDGLFSDQPGLAVAATS